MLIVMFNICIIVECCGWVEFCLEKQFLTKLENSIHATFKLFFFFWKIIMLSHCASKFFSFSSRSSTRQILYMVSLHFMIIVQEKIFHALMSLSFLTTTKQQRLPLLRDFSTSTYNFFIYYLYVSTNNFMTALITWLCGHVKSKQCWEIFSR